MYEVIGGVRAAPTECDEREAGPRNLLRRSRLKSAKCAFTTRRVDFSVATNLVRDGTPRAGDLVLAAVTSIGKHTRLESPQGRRMHLYEGDEIIVAYGARYAPDQFEASVPDGLGECDLVASGGVAAHVIARHAATGRPTRIAPIGLIADKHGDVLNLARFALPDCEIPLSAPRVVVIAGSTMNAGKTTTASSLIHGLSRAGLIVEAAKVTGTGSGLDVWSMLDAGARSVHDFTDMGHASTAGLDLATIERIALSLIAYCAANRPDVVVIEVADGLFQRETGALLESARFRAAIDGIVFAAGDALSAVGGRDWLELRGHRILGISGQVSASPLASREAEARLGLPVYTKACLRNREIAPQIAFAADPVCLVG